MPLVDLKREPEKKEVTEAPIDDQESTYPYELRITLGKQELSKLNLAVDDFKIGASINFEAAGKVSGLTQRERTDFESRTVEIQITAIDLKTMDKTVMQSTTTEQARYDDFRAQQEAGPGE